MSDMFLHTAPDQSVWGFARGETPRQLASTVGELLQQPLPERARLLSRGFNDELQYELQCRGVAVWAAANGVTSRQPFAALLQLASCQLSGSLGGWWRCHANDLATYRLRFDLAGIKDHPVLSQLKGISAAAAQQQLVQAVDPRRFIDPAKPASSARFRAFLGVSPRFFRRNISHPMLLCVKGWVPDSPDNALKAASLLASMVWEHWMKLVLAQ